MTKIEAIEALKMNNALMCFDAITGDDIPYEFLNSTNKAVYDANLIAIEALKKQIPKKPIIKDWDYARCPSCGAGLSEHLGDGYYKHYTHWEYCHNPECLQRLDWEGEE